MTADPLSSLLFLPLGLGLLGFIEPCSIGSSLLFVKAVEGKPTATRLAQAAIFTVTRSLFIGVLGIMAALVGAVFLGLQRAGWVVLGGLYLALGVVYLTGNAGRLMVSFGPSLKRLSTVRGMAALGVLFGLNIPACAAPLLAAVLGAAAVGGTAQAARGFVLLALFGLALSLPLVAVLLWAPARRSLDRMAALSSRLPVAIGLLFIALGAWSVYFGLFVPVRV